MTHIHKWLDSDSEKLLLLRMSNNSQAGCYLPLLEPLQTILIHHSSLSHKIQNSSQHNTLDGLPINWYWHVSRNLLAILELEEKGGSTNKSPIHIARF